MAQLVLTYSTVLCRNGYYLPGVAQVGADPGGAGGSLHEPEAHIWSQLTLIYSVLCRNGYYLPGVAQVGADPGGGGGSWHEPVAQTRQVTQPNFCQFVPISIKSILCQTWRESICTKSTSFSQGKIRETCFYEIFIVPPAQKVVSKLCTN